MHPDHHARRRLPFVLPLIALLMLMLMLGAACGDDDDDDVADDIQSDSASSASPTAGGGVDADVQEVEITIEGGEFSSDEVEFQVTNNDGERYLLTIGDLVAEEWPIAPNQATTVEFTTPNAAEYEAELLPDGGGEPLDTMTVVVQDPGGVDVD
jgi:hypothetical protein